MDTDDQTFEAPEETTWWDHFWGEQKRLTTEYLLAPSNRSLVTVAIVGGVISSLALGKLYIKLSTDPADSDLKTLTEKGLTAVVLGVGYVFWELNKTQYQSAEDVLDVEFTARDIA
jgi:hypothetical protein